MTGLCIPVGWFCGLLVSQAAQCLLVLPSFSSSSSVHWPGEGADSLLCVESNLFLLVYLLLSSSGSIFLLCPSGFCFLSLSLAIPVCFLPVSFCYSLGLLLSLFWRDLWSLPARSGEKRWLQVLTLDVELVQWRASWDLCRPDPSLLWAERVSEFVHSQLFLSPPLPWGGWVEGHAIDLFKWSSDSSPSSSTFSVAALPLSCFCGSSLLTLAIWSTSRVYVTSEVFLLKWNSLQYNNYIQHFIYV